MPHDVQVSEVLVELYYPLVVQVTDCNGVFLGFRVREDGGIEYFGDYDPDPQTKYLHEIMGKTVAQRFPRVTNPAPQYVTPVSPWGIDVRGHGRGQPCDHSGCAQHVFKPCDGCGRYQAGTTSRPPTHKFEGDSALTASMDCFKCGFHPHHLVHV